MIALPPALHLEILHFLPLRDRLEYLRLNGSLSRELGRNVRQLFLFKESDQKQFLFSRLFRKNLIEKIKFPHQQIHLNFISDYGDHFSEVPSEISLCSFKTKTRLLQQLLPKINQIQQLTINDVNELDDSSTQSERIQKVLHHLSELKCLSQLSLQSTPIEHLPALTHLQSLELFSCHNFDFAALDISKFTSLRCLKFTDCIGISDVSSLGNIYELHLRCCPSVSNISSLNNNKIVVIKDCPIDDYSKSFEYTRVLDLMICRSDVVPMDLTRLKAIQSLTIDFNYSTSLIEPSTSIQNFGNLPRSLKELTIRNFDYSFSLPDKHCLRRLRIESCNNIDLKNLSLKNIPYVEICHCNQIEDWSPLQSNKTVQITCCSGFTDANQLKDVKTLKVDIQRSTYLSNLRYITHLFVWKRNIYYSPAFIQNLSAAEELKELEFSIDDIKTVYSLFYDIWKIIDSLKCLTKLEKVIINHLNDDEESFEKLCQRMQDVYGDLFLLDIREFKIIILKTGGNSGVMMRKDKTKEFNLMASIGAFLMFSLIYGVIFY